MRYYISPTGSDSNDGLTPSSAFLTLSQAHTACSAGDIIELTGGTFSASNFVADITKDNITIIGQNQGIDPNTGQRGEESNIAGYVDPMITFYGDNCEINGIEFSGSAHRTIRYSGCTGMKIRYNIIGNNSTRRYYIYGLNSPEAEISYNKMYGCYYGMNIVGQCDNTKIHHNYLSDISGYFVCGISVSTGNGSVVLDGVEIYENTIWDLKNSGCGIIVGGGTGASGKFENSKIYNNYIYQCECSSEQTNGIVFASLVYDCEIYGNTIKNLDTPIYSYWQVHGSNIYNNKFINCQVAIRFDNYYNAASSQGEIIITDNHVESDPKMFAWNWGQFFIVGMGIPTTISGNRVFYKSGVVGSEVNKIWGDDWVGGSCYGVMVYGSKLDDLTITDNQFYMGKTVAAQTYIDDGNTKTIDVDYTRPYGVVLFTVSTAGTLPSGADITIKNNKIYDSIDGGGVALRDSVNNLWGQIPANVTTDLTQNVFNNCKNGVTGGAGTIADAKVSQWGNGSKPSGGLADPSTGTVANGVGSIVSSGVYFDPVDTTIYRNNAIAIFRPLGTDIKSV